MVGDDGQLYTIEGLAAALIMLVTAYLVLGTTTVFSPGDMHIADMQLEQLGSDVLATMDIPIEEGGVSDLETYIATDDDGQFVNAFTGYLRSYTGSTQDVDDIQFYSTVYYRTGNTLGNYSFADSGERGELVAREPSVTVSRWIELDNRPTGHGEVDNRKQFVLLEVVLWRG